MYTYQICCTCKECEGALISDILDDIAHINKNLKCKCSKCNREVTLDKVGSTRTILVRGRGEDK